MKMKTNRGKYDLEKLSFLKHVDANLILTKTQDIDTYSEQLDVFIEMSEMLNKELNPEFIASSIHELISDIENLIEITEAIGALQLLWSLKRFNSLLRTGKKQSYLDMVTGLKKSILDIAADIHGANSSNPSPSAALTNTTEAAKRDAKNSILVVDDMPDILNTVQTALKDHYSIYAMTSSEMALKFLDTRKADVLLLDIDMPVIDGYTLLALARESKLNKDTPAMFLTSNATYEYLQRARDLGAADFIVKPVDKDILLKKIARQIKKNKIKE